MAKAKEQEKIKTEIRSGEVQEIMGHPPRWIIRWGIGLIFTVALIFLAGSYVFKYPDIITAPVIITTENPPVAVIAKATGKIQNLYVRDQELVQEDKILAVIENPAQVEEVYNLIFSLTDFRGFLEGFEPDRIPQLEDVQNLGVLQQAYSTLKKTFLEYISFMEIDYHNTRIQSLREEIRKYRSYYQNLNHQKVLLENELELSRRQLARDSLLRIQGVISPADYEKSEAACLMKQRDLVQAQVNLSTVDIDISENEQDILDLQLEYKDQKNNYELALRESYDNLMSDIAQWEQTYVLKAPKRGMVSLSRFWSVDQNVTEGDAVLSVVPENPGAIIGKMNMSIRRSGKVETGHEVQIKIDNYPYMEYGVVNGIIKSISLVPTDQFYTVEITLPVGLKTNYGKELEFDQEMSGIAEIITEKRRLIARILDPFKYIFEKSL